MFLSGVLDNWFSCLKPNHQASLRLFCLPFAGGGASVYRLWASELSESFEVYSIQLPGREDRLQEAPFKQIRPLVQTLAVALQPYLDKPFAVWGHSLGALICFELARELRRRRCLQPAHLLVGGSLAPHLPLPNPPIYHLPESEFIEELREYNGTPEAVFQNRELMQLLLPLLRADFEIHETYQYLVEEPLDCPITVFGGQDDPDVAAAQLNDWAKHTNGRFNVHILPGGHFFLHNCRTQLLQLISQELEMLTTTANY